jgi:hypothetical protein
MKSDETVAGEVSECSLAVLGISDIISNITIFQIASLSRQDQKLLPAY